jgi:hypothetical protein
LAVAGVRRPDGEDTGGWAAVAGAVVVVVVVVVVVAVVVIMEVVGAVEVGVGEGVIDWWSNRRIWRRYSTSGCSAG